jgi:release factor glutamine methyltransferase
VASDGGSTTVGMALRQAREAGLERLDAHLIVAHVLGRTHAWLVAHDGDTLAEADALRVTTLVQRRAAGEPLAYLEGTQEFFALNLRVTPDVLIPRPDTEALVNWALELIPSDRPCRVADLGTGSGAIALAIAHHRPLAHLTAVDVSDAALRVARSNAQALRLDNVHFAAGSWLTPLKDQLFDLIVSNPPYIAEGDPHLPALRFEPISALTAGPDGLCDLRHIIANAGGHMHDNGRLLLEHGYDQSGEVTHLMSQAGFASVSTRFDFGGHPRCTGGCWQI